MDWITTVCTKPDESAFSAAAERQNSLTKPAGSLGRLEDLALWLAACQGDEKPSLATINIVVFAADHGVAAAGVSAYPQAVTAEMLRNFSRGGAAINVLARQLEATLTVVNLGTVEPLETLPNVRDAIIAAGTADLSLKPAMTSEQCRQAMTVGRRVVEEMAADKTLFVGGEMGIGNTTAATALGCALLAMQPEMLVGPGTGVSEAGLAKKLERISAALQLHTGKFDDPFQTLCCLGGFEIAALTGGYIAAAQAGIPCLVDGFITTAAALAAVKINPSIRPWLQFGHGSAEPGHAVMLNALEAKPILQLDMRLGEGTGAALAANLLHQACALHNNMATFAEAAVSQKAEAIE